MKKFFTLIVVLAATVCSAHAEGEGILYEGSDAINWDGIALDVSKITADKGLSIGITIETSTGDWWQFKFSQTTVEGWPGLSLDGTNEYVNANNASYNWSAGTYSYIFDLTETQIEALKKGIKVQGEISNGATLTLKNVTVYYANEIQSFDTPIAVGNWEQGFNIEHDKFSQCQAGDMLVFTKTDDPAGTYHQLKAQIANTTTVLENLTSTDGVINVGSSKKIGVKLTANDVEKAKTNGIYVGGYMTNVSKVELFRTTSWTTTSINAVSSSATATKAMKTIENGKVVIVKDGNKFNAAGQMLK